MAFQIHSVLHLSMPAGQIDQIVSQVNAKLRTINGAINLNINPSAIKNIQSLNTQLLSLDKTLQSIAINSTTAATSLSRLGSSLSATQAKTSAISSSMSTVTNSIGAVKVASGEGAVALEHFSSQAGLALRRFLAFGVAAGSVLAVFSGIKAGISSAIEFQRQMVRLQQVGETSRSALAGISTEITRLAVNFGASSKDLAEAAVVIRQAGYSANETKVALEALAQAALSPNFDNMKQNTEGAIAILSQFKLSMDQLLPSFGSVNAVAAAFAVEAKDIIQAVQRAGGVFSGLGGNLHEFIALFSSVRATTRESAETISTGLRTIFARLQRSDTVEALREFRVELRRTAAEAQQLGDLGLTDQFVGPYEAIRRISEAIRNIPDTDPRIAQLFEQIGGYRQLSRLLPLLRESDTQDRALNISRGGEISLLASTEKAQESLINKTHQTGEAFASLFRKIADDKGFQTFISAGLRITGMLADWLKILTPLVPLLLTVGTIKLFQAISPLGRPAQSFTQTFVGNSNPPFIPIPGGPRRYASGGIVPGHGFTDNQPAVLESGSFVIRRDSAQKIGYDNLSRMGFNKGGSVPVILTPGEFVFDEKQAARIGSPQLHHMNNTGKIPGMAGGGNANAELLASIGISPTKPSRETSEKLKSYTSSGGIHPAWVKALTKSDESYFARKSIAKASEINEINDMIPAGSKFIANGAFAFAVRTPDGQVLRIQATDRPVQRSDFPEALQANESKYISGVNVEKLDYVPDIYSMVESGQMSSGRASRVIEAMKKRLLNKRDYKARDLHEGNIGYTRGTGFKIIDPDFASGGMVNKSWKKYAEGGEIEGPSDEELLRNLKKIGISGPELENLLKSGDFSTFAKKAKIELTKQKIAERKRKQAIVSETSSSKHVDISQLLLGKLQEIAQTSGFPNFNTSPNVSLINRMLAGDIPIPPELLENVPKNSTKAVTRGYLGKERLKAVELIKQYLTPEQIKEATKSLEPKLTPSEKTYENFAKIIEESKQYGKLVDIPKDATIEETKKLMNEALKEEDRAKRRKSKEKVKGLLGQKIKEATAGQPAPISPVIPPTLLNPTPIAPTQIDDPLAKLRKKITTKSEIPPAIPQFQETVKSVQPTVTVVPPIIPTSVPTTIATPIISSTPPVVPETSIPITPQSQVFPESSVKIPKKQKVKSSSSSNIPSKNQNAEELARLLGIPLKSAGSNLPPQDLLNIPLQQNRNLGNILPGVTTFDIHGIPFRSGDANIPPNLLQNTTLTHDADIARIVATISNIDTRPKPGSFVNNAGSIKPVKTTRLYSSKIGLPISGNILKPPEVYGPHLPPNIPIGFASNIDSYGPYPLPPNIPIGFANDGGFTINYDSYGPSSSGRGVQNLNLPLIGTNPSPGSYAADPFLDEKEKYNLRLPLAGTPVVPGINIPYKDTSGAFRDLAGTGSVAEQENLLYPTNVLRSPNYRDSINARKLSRQHPFDIVEQNINLDRQNKLNSGLREFYNESISHYDNSRLTISDQQKLDIPFKQQSFTGPNYTTSGFSENDTFSRNDVRQNRVLDENGKPVSKFIGRINGKLLPRAFNPNDEFFNELTAPVPRPYYPRTPLEATQYGVKRQGFQYIPGFQKEYLNSQGFGSEPFAPGFIDPFNQGPERLRAPLKGQFSTSQLNKEIGPENLKSDIRSFYQKQVDLEQNKLPANQRLLETTPEVESRVANFQIKQQYGRILQNLINSADNQIARKDFAKKDVELQSQILKERANNLEQLKQINKDTNITYRKKGFFSSETEISSVGGSGSGEGFLGRLLGRGMSSEAYAARIQSLAYGGVLAAPIISQYLSSGVGQATEESGTGFKGIRSFAGGLQGAAVGGFAAQALGARTPLTLGLGILAGAVLGAAQALQEAEREIRAAKIEKQMATFGSTLQVITNQLQRTGTVSGSDARENINSLRQTMSLVEESAADRASSLYGWIPGTEQSVNSARDRELRQTFSSQAGGIFNFLSQSAQQFGRENSQIPNLPRSQNQLRNDFFAGNDGLNARYISLLSRLNNRSIESTLNQFNEDIIRGQARGQRLTAEGSENRTFSAFGKLASILEETVRNFNRFNTVLRGISGIVSGRSELGTIEPPTDLFSRLGTPGFAQNIISGLEVAGGRGEGLQESLLNLNRVAEILPDVLAFARNSPNAQSAGINVRQGLISSLGFTQENLPTSLAQIIGTVQSRISDQSFEDLKKNFEDTQKTAREILQPFQAIVETAQRLGQSQTTYLNSLFQGLNQYNNLLLQSGETLNRSVVQRFEAIRTRAGFEADRTGLAQFSLISREQATRPFSSRQEFLTQGTGVANIYDPREIANNINITREEIARRTTDLVNNPGNLRNGTNNGEALRVLNDRAVRLNQALENLANSSNRTAYAQARLSELTQERNARFNASASYIASGADGQLETRRYLAIANRALESGRGFSGIASDDAAGTIRTLQGLGGVRNENGRSFENILQELIARTNGLPFNPDQNIGQIRSFQAEITAAQIAQADATAQLAIVQTSATERFFQELSANQARFLAELQVRFIEADIARVRARRDNRAGDLRPLAALQTSVDTIRTLTGTTDENSTDLLSSLNNVSIRNRLTTLQNRYRPLADLRTTLEQPGRVDQILQQVDIGEILTRTRARIRAGGQGWNRMILQNEAGNELLAGSNNNGINSVLSSLGITSPEATEQFRIRFRTGASNQFRTGTETQDSIRALVSSTLGEVLNIQTSRFLAQDVNRNDLRDVNAAPGLQGVNIQDLLLTGQLDALLTASQRLRQENITSFQTLSERLGVVTTSLRGFNAELATLQATLAIANIPHGQDFDDYLTGQGYFSGGPVYAQRGKLINFEPRGTDTVPAMLTPGEFVVNATSTRKYLDLLRNINENRSPLEGLDQYFKGGTVYAAAGAFINPGLSAIDFRDAVNPDYRPQLRELSRARFQTEREAVRNFGGASALLDYVRRSGEANNNSGDIVGGINRFLAAQSRNILLSQINAQGGQRDREQGQFISQAFSDRVQGNLNSFRNLSSLRQSAFTNREQINQAEERENRFINRGPRFLTPRVDLRPFRNFDFFDRNRRFHTGGEVPAYLTAGEYVLRPEAVSNIGIGTLNRMNYASGGQVGNAISSAVNESSLGSAPRLREAVSVRQDDGLVNALQRFNGDNQPLITAFNNFSNASGKLAESLSKFPSSVTIEGRQTVEVIINGTEAWANIKPEVQEMIVKQTKTELNNFIKNKFPDINTD